MEYQELEMFFFTPHRYLVTASGIKCKEKSFTNRLDAERYMWKICKKLGIFGIECSEYDKHERKYSNHKGVRFYINRI